MTTKSLVRIQVELPQSRVELMDSIMDLTGTRTRREIVDQAILLLSWAVKVTGEGRIVGAMNADNNSYQEVVLPLLADTPKDYAEPQKKPKAARRENLAVCK